MLLHRLFVLEQRERMIFMLKICTRGALKAAGLAILAFCLGVLAGKFLPPFWLAVIEMAILAVFGYLCLFRW